MVQATSEQAETVIGHPATSIASTDVLLALADLFETFASDQRGSIRWMATKRDKMVCNVKAVVWEDAASLIRERALPLISGDRTVAESSREPARAALAGAKTHE